MSDSLTVFGTDYTGVTGIKATGTNNGTFTYIRPQGTKSISENGTGIDVAAYANVDVNVSSSDFVITLTKNSSTGMWMPDCTYVEAYAAYTAGKNIVFTTGTYDGAYGGYDADEGYFVYGVDENFTSYSPQYEYGYVCKWYFFKSTGVESDGSENYYSTISATAAPADVLNGKVFYNRNGVQTGTLAVTTYYTSTSDPTSSQGSNGDIWLVTE